MRKIVDSALRLPNIFLLLPIHFASSSQTHIEDYHGFVCHLIDDMTFPFHFFSLFFFSSELFLLKSTNSFSFKE
jgi:hypothetical protein